MADFKKLSAVEMIESVKDSATVLIEEDGVIKRMPKDEIGGIKITTPVEVGQTIVVKAVDETGKPTEWECAEMPSVSYGFDLVVQINATGNTNNDYATLIHGDTNKVISKLNAGQMVLPAVGWIRWDGIGAIYTTVDWYGIEENQASFMAVDA